VEISEIVFYLSLVALGLLVGRYFVPLTSERRSKKDVEARLSSSERTRDRLEKKLQRLAREQEILAGLLHTLPSTATRLAESRHLDEVAQAVGEAAMRLLRAEEVAVLIKEGDTLQPLWTGGLGAGKLQRKPIQMPGGQIAVSLKAGNIASKDDLKDVDGLPVSPELWAPIRHRGELQGIIHLARIRGEGTEGRRLLAVLSHLASMSFRSIELYDRLASFNKQLEAKVHERTIELRRAYEELKELDRAKDEFISSVSHELRTPLTSIRSFSELLLTFDDDDRDRKEEFLGIINDESKRLTRLIDDVLDIAKIESGQSEWRMRKLDMVELVRSTVEFQKPAANEQNLQLRVETGSGLHAVIADRDRIKQVLMNLLSNALKFSHPGGEVVVSSEIDESDVKVVVADQGTGIAPEDRDRVFMRFQQLGDTDSGKPAGTGLGLAICMEIVSRHGGRIWVEDNTPRGSRFCFTLPVLPDEPEEEPAITEQS
jgi:signal transduction histidine kinase